MESKCCCNCKCKEALQKLQQTVHSMELSLNIIHDKIDRIYCSSENMDHHISFVENVYEVVKSPFKQALQFYYGTESTPQIDSIEMERKSTNNRIESNMETDHNELG